MMLRKEKLIVVLATRLSNKRCTAEAEDGDVLAVIAPVHGDDHPWLMSWTVDSIWRPPAALLTISPACHHVDINRLQSISKMFLNVFGPIT